MSHKRCNGMGKQAKYQMPGMGGKPSIQTNNPAAGTGNGKKKRGR